MFVLSRSCPTWVLRLSFSDLEDEMDSLRTHVGQLRLNTNIAGEEQRMRKAYDREEEEERESREAELGEGDSPRATRMAKASTNSGGVLDASAADLSKDLTVQFSHTSTAPTSTEGQVDVLMKKLRSISGADGADQGPHKLVHKLDDSVEFLEVSSGGVTDEVDDGVTDDIVIQDLQSSGKSLVDRANMEASQSQSMDDDDDDLESEADDLGEVEKQENEADKSLDDLDKVFADNPRLDNDDDDDSTAQNEAKLVVTEDEDGGKVLRTNSHKIGSIAQDTAVKKAQTFANKEDQKEEEAIKRMQQREKVMEESAKANMYKQMKKMNDEVSQEQAKLSATVKSHKKTEEDIMKSQKPQENGGR